MRIVVHNHFNTHDQAATWKVSFKQPGVAAAWKTVSVQANSKQEAEKKAKIEIQQFGAGWRLVEQETKQQDQAFMRGELEKPERGTHGPLTSQNKPGDEVILNSGRRVKLVRRSDRNGQERWEVSNGGFWYPSDGGKVGDSVTPEEETEIRDLVAMLSAWERIGKGPSDRVAKLKERLAVLRRKQHGDRARDQLKPAREMSRAEIEAELATAKPNGFGLEGGKVRYDALKTALSEKKMRGEDRPHLTFGGKKNPKDRGLRMRAKAGVDCGGDCGCDKCRENHAR
jgi:uncharacterized protein (DUF736 family)